MLKAKPFVKWVGGKRQLIDKIKKYLPEDYNTYYEPFVGGGALLFELMPRKAVINDYNSELMNVYECIKNPEKIEKMLNELNSYETENNEEFYYKIRNLDKDKKAFNKLADYKRAARTIYLNKACFNGLYRVNSNNEFNVPYCKKEKVNTYDRTNIGMIYCYFDLCDIKMLNGDFEEAVKDAKKGDFIYFDPPYDSDTKTFTDYTDDGFGKDEQIRLANLFKKLTKKGCYVMLSNHNTKLINELYCEFNIHIVKAKRCINSNGSKRGEVEEVIITNYKTEEE